MTAPSQAAPSSLEQVYGVLDSGSERRGAGNAQEAASSPSKTRNGFVFKKSVSTLSAAVSAAWAKAPKRHSSSRLSAGGGGEGKSKIDLSHHSLMRRLPTSIVVLLIFSTWMIASILSRTFVLMKVSRLSPRSREGRSSLALQGSRLAIFAVPLSHSEASMSVYRISIQSWLRLQHPTPHIYLIGSHPALQSLVQVDPRHVHVEADVDTNMEGVPQFHSVLARASAAGKHADLLLLVDPTVVLFPDLLLAASKVASRFSSWILAGASWSIPRGAQDVFTAELERVFSEPHPEAGLAALQQTVREHGRLQVRRSAGGASLGLGFLLWPSSSEPLVTFPVPPFAMGRGSSEEWLLHHLARSVPATGLGEGLGRQVVDASESTTSVRLRVAASIPAADSGELLTPKSWEFFANSHMATNFGEFMEGQGTVKHCPWQLARCFTVSAETASPGTSATGSKVRSASQCLLRRRRPGNCSCEHSSGVSSSSGDMRPLDGFYWACGRNNVDQFDYFIDPNPSESGAGGPNSQAVPGLPHTLEQLLPRVADQHRTVVLVAVVRAYAEMALNFICMLQSMGVKNYLVAALDEDMYRYAFIQGLPVFYATEATVYPEAGGARKEGASEDPEGQEGAEGMGSSLHIILRSMTVLRILRLGYDVLLSDPDIVWFQDPQPHLRSLSPDAILFQSNGPRESEPANGVRMLNSGFYFARARKATIEAFEAVTSQASQPHAASEQSTFYDVLCGREGEYRVGTESCMWTPSQQQVLFLDRRLYPNGAVSRLWASSNVARKCQERGCYILHNNYITGLGAKMARLQQKGFIFYDPLLRMCKKPWLQTR